MSKRTYSLDSAREQLDRCDVKTDHSPTSRVIYVSRFTPPGLRAWGAIDYLRKEHGFTIERV